MEKMLEEYYLTRNKNLRNEIAIHFMYLAERSAKKNSSNSNYDYEELLSYAYEGLIKGIESYNKDNNKYTFLTYLYYFIESYIRRGVFCLKFNQKHYPDHILNRIDKVIELIEFRTGKKISEDANLINEIMVELKKHINISKIVESNMKNFILRYYGVTNDAEDYNIIYNNLNDYLSYKIIKEKIHSAIKSLSPEYQNVILRYYDLDIEVDEFDINAKGISRQAINKKKHYALKQLKKNPEIQDLQKILPIIKNKRL